MKLDNLKNIKPKNIKVDNADTNYADYLCALPQDKPKKQVWGVIGTIAAAILIVLAVSLWAIIGRGVRGAGEPIVSPPATEGETVEITEELEQQFELMALKYVIFALPEFKRGEIPHHSDVIDYIYYLQLPAKDDLSVTAAELNEFAFNTFGVKTEYTTGVNYDAHYTVNLNWAPLPLLSFKRDTLSDGTPIVTLTYGEPDVSVTTLTYIAKVGFDFEPEYFIEHTTLNTVILKKTKDNNTAADLYKISEKLADELLDFVRDATDTKDRSVCYCVPTHTIVFNDVEYKVVLGSKFTSHIVYTDARDATTNHKLSEAEFNKLKGLLDQCITDKNFIKTQKISYTPSADKVTVTVNKLEVNYKQGTHTITGEDAKALITALETKSYTGFYGLQGLSTAVLKIDERSYYLNISNDYITIENACGGLQLSKDDDIVKIVEKYIKNSDETIIETGHSTYDKVTLINATETCLAAIKERKVVDRANENPTSKTFELDGKTLELTFKEKIPAPAAGGYLYNYADSDGVLYDFYENKYFIYISDLSTHNKNSTAITKDEAFEIADKYARVMLGNDYENYQITVSEDFNSELYHFDFEKKYGKDGFLSGENFGAYIYKNGRIKSCSAMNKYMFENFDPLLVKALTKEDVDKALIKAYQDEGNDMSLYTPKADSYFLTNYEGKWYVGVNSVLYIGEESKSRSNLHYFEIA